MNPRHNPSCTESLTQLKTATSEPFVSIVILTHNGHEILERCIDSITKTRYPNFEIVLVDNASTDGSIAVIDGKYGANPNFTIVKNNYNAGFAEGNNIGAENTQGDLLVFLNDDTEVSPDWLDDLVQTAMNDQFVGIVLPRVISRSSPDGLLVGNVDWLGNAVLVDINTQAANCGNFSPKASDMNNGLSNFETIAAGPAFLIKRRVWEDLGGFDSKYFIYGEDIDLSWRARLVGFRTVLSDRSFVFHEIAGTMRKSGLNERRYLTYRNMLRTLIKDYSTRYLPRVIPPFLVIRMGEALTLSLLVRNPRVITGMMRAMRWNLQHFADSWRLHGSIQKKRITSEREIKRVMARLSIAGLSPIPMISESYPQK
jgi:GT2 family glycosyltransferase